MALTSPQVVAIATTMHDLEPFGFTATESRVYVALLGTSPATGYTVARQARLARANTYEALEALALRGAVTRIPGRPARWVAEVPEALVERLGRESRAHLDQLARNLASMSRAPGTQVQPVELLPDRAAVLERAAAWARAAREELLAVAGPWASELFADLAEARRSRVVVRLLSLGSPGPAGAVVRPVAPSEIRTYWGGLPIAIVVDRRRALCAMDDGAETSGVATTHPALVPFLRHLLRRELAAAGHQPGPELELGHVP